jgi:hypothetical protein
LSEDKVQYLTLHLTIQIVSGGFVIATDKNLTGNAVEAAEKRRLGIATGEPGESGQVVVDSGMQRPKQIHVDVRLRHNAMLTARLDL